MAKTKREERVLFRKFMGLGNDIEGRISFLYEIGEAFPFTGDICEEGAIGNEVVKELEEQVATDFLVETYSFDTSWEWLMPVIIEIESLGFLVDIFNNSMSVHHKDGTAIVDFGDKKSNKFDIVYRGALAFIKWYNKNN